MEVGRTTALLTKGREFAPLLGGRGKHEVGGLVPRAVLFAHLANASLDPKAVGLWRFQVHDFVLEQSDLLFGKLLQLHFEDVCELALLCQVVVAAVSLAQNAFICATSDLVLEHGPSKLVDEISS